MHPAIQKYRATLDEQRKFALNYEQAAIDGSEAIKLKPPNPNGDVRQDSIRLTDCGLFIALYVDSFKQAVPVLREMRKRGYKLGPAYDDFSLRRRWWSLNDGIFTLTGSIIVDATVGYNDNSTCKRVQTGVKEEPVYEWRCEDGSDVEAVEEDGAPA